MITSCLPSLMYSVPSALLFSVSGAPKHFSAADGLLSGSWLNTASWIASFAVFLHLGSQMTTPSCLEKASSWEPIKYTAYTSHPVCRGLYLTACSEILLCSPALASFLLCSAPRRLACSSGNSLCVKNLLHWDHLKMAFPSLALVLGDHGLCIC